jgi:hypothetical protein
MSHRDEKLRVTNDERTVLIEALDEYIRMQDTVYSLSKGIRRTKATAAQWRLFVAQQLRNEL